MFKENREAKHTADNGEGRPFDALVMCSCGCGLGVNHVAGLEECYRFVVTDPDEIPRNRRKIYDGERYSEPTWVWDVGDQTITEYTLFQQRLYGYDEKTGQWTRPKSRDSVNSLKGDW